MIYMENKLQWLLDQQNQLLITEERDDIGLKYYWCAYQSGIIGWLSEYDVQQPDDNESGKNGWINKALKNYLYTNNPNVRLGAFVAAQHESEHIITDSIHSSA